MKIMFVTILSVMVFTLRAQVPIDSLQQKLSQVTSPVEKIDVLNALAHTYTQVSLGRADELARQALALAQDVNYPKGIATSYNVLGISASIQGRHAEGMDNFLKAVRIRETLNDVKGISHVYNNIARVFILQKDYDRAIEYTMRSVETMRKIDDPRGLANAYVSLGEIYRSKGDLDRALEMFTEARDISIHHKLGGYQLWTETKRVTVLNAKGEFAQALEAGIALEESISAQSDFFSKLELYETIGLIYSNVGNQDRATAYLHKARRMADAGKDNNARINVRKYLRDMYRKFRNYDSAWYYNDQYNVLRDEAVAAEKSQQLATLEHVYQTEKKDQLLYTREQEINRLTAAMVTGGVVLVAITILVIFIFRLYRDKRKSLQEMKRLHHEIYEKHEEILAQAEELTQANEEIRRMNESLEAEVQERVAEVQLQNEKLIEYAYFNAHNVRGPLARILGLSMLMSGETSEQALKQYNTYMFDCAQELDGVVREINRKLSN